MRWHWNQITELALYNVESISSRQTVCARAVSNLEEQDGIKIWKDIHWYCFSRLTSSLRVEKISLCLVCQDLQIPLSGFLLLDSRPTRTSCQSNLKKLLRRDQETIAPEELQTSGALALERFILRTHILSGVLENENIAHLSFPSPDIFLPVLFLLRCTSPPKKVFSFSKYFPHFLSPFFFSCSK